MDAVVRATDDEETFARAQRLGFAGVEVDLSRDELFSGDRLETLRRAAAGGLAVPSIVLGEHSDRGGIADPDPLVAEEARDDVVRAIEWAAELGAGAILLPFFGRAELVDEAGVDRAAEAFRPLCERAGERGVMLCYEGTLPAARIRGLADRIASRAFGCYFDLANPVVRGLDSATEIRTLGELVRRVHFKDARVGTGDCTPGLGTVDYAACYEALDEIGYDGWVVLETPPVPAELVARDLSFARTVLSRLARDDDWPRLGMFTYEFGRGEWDRLIETCRTFGLSAVQLGKPLLDECLEEPDRVPEIRGALEDAGISVVALAGYRNLVNPDANVRSSTSSAAASSSRLRSAPPWSLRKPAPGIPTASGSTRPTTGARRRGGSWTMLSPSSWRSPSARARSSPSRAM
jgi:sugar phosphate isomerase/epimerase